MRRIPVAVAVIAQLLACGGKDDVTTLGALAGTWAITEVQCGGGPGPASLAPRLAAGRTWKLITPDGYAATLAMADSSCTIAEFYNQSYPAAGTVIATGSGVLTCTPSTAACAALSTALFARNVCGEAATDTGTWTYTSVPTTAGGTMTATQVSATTACSAESLPNPLAFIFTRQ
ncbi:MAG TPA: hypothetical protein VFR85_16985 [Anaeromyxobacteraceae bacterium]|nr:hypothetical protein [Anaeromyxobacteraceae bacterium]